MAILNFSDVLKKVGLDPKRVKLIRHSLTDREFRKCYEKNMVMGIYLRPERQFYQRVRLLVCFCQRQEYNSKILCLLQGKRLCS